MVDRCKIAHYCSTTCQKMDWKHHKLECGEQQQGDKNTHFNDEVGLLVRTLTNLSQNRLEEHCVEVSMGFLSFVFLFLFFGLFFSVPSFSPLCNTLCLSFWFVWWVGDPFKRLLWVYHVGFVTLRTWTKVTNHLENLTWQRISLFLFFK